MCQRVMGPLSWTCQPPTWDQCCDLRTNAGSWVRDAPSDHGRGQRIQNRGVSIILSGLVVVGGSVIRKCGWFVCEHQGVKRYDGITGG